MQQSVKPKTKISCIVNDAPRKENKHFSDVNSYHTVVESILAETK